MADTSQPTVFDYASPTTWRIKFARIPKVEWFCTNVNLPGITLGEAQYPTPMMDTYLTGDKLTFDNLIPSIFACDKSAFSNIEFDKSLFSI